MAQPTSAPLSRMLRALSAATATIAAIAASTPATADEGIANYASYLDRGYALEAAATLEQTLASKVLIAQVNIDGQTYLRLHSPALDPIEAKSLVVRATAQGMDAWYQGVSAATPEPLSVEPISNSIANQHSIKVAPQVKPVITPKVTVATPPPIQLTSANPKLAEMLPEGPLLGELYPPRSPVTGN